MPAPKLDPEGKPWALPHRRKSTGKRYRIVEDTVYSLSSGRICYLIANEAGYLFIVPAYQFEQEFEYIPGGQ